MPQIVCFDPRKQHVPGTIIEDSQAPRLQSQHVGLLPVNRDRIFRSAANTFSQRHMGSDGWHYDRNQTPRGCHILLDLSVPSGYKLHWLARLEPIVPESTMSGRLKLITDTARQQQLKGGLRPVERVDQISQQLDRYGGLTVYGMSEFTTTIEGIIALCLHGVMVNTRITSLSVSAIVG